ncbi:unnamed protein product, partial [Mesorhabditis spiculigera]
MDMVPCMAQALWEFDLSRATLSLMKASEIARMLADVKKKLQHLFLEDGKKVGEQQSHGVNTEEKLANARQSYEEYLTDRLNHYLKIFEDVLSIGALAGHPVCCNALQGVACFRQTLVPLIAKLLAWFIEKCEAHYASIAQYGQWVTVAGVVGAALWGGFKLFESMNKSRRNHQ